MFNFTLLLGIFGELSPENKKYLYETLIILSSDREDEETKELLELLIESKEDLLHYDEELENAKLEPVYVTQKELSIATKLSIRQIQRLLKQNNIEPVKPNTKPLFYDYDEFEKHYFNYNEKKAEEEFAYLDYSLGIPIIKERESLSINNDQIEYMNYEDELEKEVDEKKYSKSISYKEQFKNIFKFSTKTIEIKNEGGGVYELEQLANL